MTDQPAAIKATFSDWRPVKSRKVLQLIFEVSVEQTEQVLKALGTPLPHEEKWCGIALLAAEPKPEKPKRTWEELTPAEQAGIRCEEAEFADWLGDLYGADARTAAEQVRWICDVRSRANLNSDPEAARKWRELDQRYMEETGRMAKRMG